MTVHAILSIPAYLRSDPRLAPIKSQPFRAELSLAISQGLSRSVSAYAAVPPAFPVEVEWVRESPDPKGDGPYLVIEISGSEDSGWFWINPSSASDLLVTSLSNTELRRLLPTCLVTLDIRFARHSPLGD